jgi:NAD(P)H-flavin reductase
MKTSQDPMTPNLFQVQRIRRELADTFTLELTAESNNEFPFLPGQFNMIYLFGSGEVPISISGDPAQPNRLIHTIRAVGSVTEGLKSCKSGDMLGIRGPFGSAWPVEQATGQDIVIITGGIGLAPLRPAIYHLLANRQRYGKIVILYGARTPTDILFRKELERWRSRFDISVEVTVDQAVSNWSGRVGVVPKLISRADFAPEETTALICGPEIMMRFSVKALQERGVKEDHIYVSMERNMKCAIGFCGHCQLGSQFVCKDGPVFPYSQISSAFRIREL